MYDKAPSASPTFTGTVVLGTAATLVFEGATSDAFETTLTVTDPTADRTVTIPNASGNVVLDTATQTLTGKTISFTAGTTSVAPITLASGSLLISAAAGKVEFDGKSFYTTPNATSGRGVSPSAHYCALSTTRSLSSTTSAQSIFNVGLPLAASTTYEYEMFVQFDYLPGGTTITVSDLFAYTGTITSASAAYQYSSNATSYVTGSAINHKFSESVTSGTSIVSSSSGQYVVYVKRGLVRTNAAGTLTPQLQMSTTTGLATPPLITTNSYIRLIPVGSNTVNAVGAWV
jgi:hypothetical protein